MSKSCTTSTYCETYLLRFNSTHYPRHRTLESSDIVQKEAGPPGYLLPHRDYHSLRSHSHRRHAEQDFNGRYHLALLLGAH